MSDISEAYHDYFYEDGNEYIDPTDYYDDDYQEDIITRYDIINNLIENSTIFKNFINETDDKKKLKYLLQIVQYDVINNNEICKKHNLGINFLIKEEELKEQYPLTYILYLFLKIKDAKGHEKEKLFYDAHRAIMYNSQIKQSNINKEISLPYLLSLCPRRVCKYCEGKGFVMVSGKKTRTHCPRLKSECPLKEDAPLFSNKETWDLREVLKYVGLYDNQYRNIFSTILDKKLPFEYVSQVSGAYNRMNELRERLYCSHCHTSMEFDLKYSIKKLAVYATTRANCICYDKTGKLHDKNVYLSHCNSCGKIIDSRETPILQILPPKDKTKETIIDTGYFLCTHCGSAKNIPEGTICPICGSTNIEENEGIEYICQDCGAIIHKNKSKSVIPKQKIIKEKIYSSDSQDFKGETDIIKKIYYENGLIIKIRISKYKQMLLKDIKNKQNANLDELR